MSNTIFHGGLIVDWTDPEHVTLSNGGYPLNTKLVAENKNAIVLKVPGHSFRSGVGMISYAPAKFEVWEKRPEDGPEKGATKGRLYPVIEWNVRSSK